MGMQYSVIYEKSRTGWGAYPPDLPGCGATGRTLAVVKRRIRWAIKAHIKGLQEDGLPVPQATTLVEQVEVEDAA
jgi:predicted RNase H-like HicB family nuclease